MSTQADWDAAAGEICPVCEEESVRFVNGRCYDCFTRGEQLTQRQAERRIERHETTIELGQCPRCGRDAALEVSGIEMKYHCAECGVVRPQAKKKGARRREPLSRSTGEGRNQWKRS